jgi:hypothetical protein
VDWSASMDGSHSSLHMPLPGRVRVDVCMDKIHTYMCMHTHTHIYTHTQSMKTHRLSVECGASTYTHIHMYTCTYIHKYKYTCTHTHTHILTVCEENVHCGSRLVHRHNSAFHSVGAQKTPLICHTRTILHREGGEGGGKCGWRGVLPQYDG